MKIGIVGARGLSTLLGFNAIDGVEVTAICDLDQDLLDRVSKEHNIKNTYRIYLDMLASDIDAVVVATPMQLHVQQSIEAMQAGKHVLSEVTAGVNMDELWWLKETVESTGKTYMMAENYCYMPQIQQIENMVKKGLFGDVYFGEGEYIHEAAKLGYSGGIPTWRKYWHFGTMGNFYPTHSLGPVMKWFNDDKIISVSTMGCGNNTRKDFRQGDTNITLIQTKSGKLIKLRHDCLSQRPHNLTYYSLQGTLGCYEAPRGMGDDHKIWLKGMDENTDKAKWRPLSDFDEYLPDRYKNATEKQKKAGHNGGDFFIVKDFVDAVNNKTKPYVDVYDACEWTAVAFLSSLSIQNGGRTFDMPNFRGAKTYKDQEFKI